MSDIVKELRASVSLDAVHGDAQERMVCANQMARAATEIERLRGAAWIFRTYGLPPEDVSGRAEWDRALLLLVGTDAAAKAGGDDE